jgi:hypothetical protein
MHALLHVILRMLYMHMILQEFAGELTSGGTVFGEVFDVSGNQMGPGLPQELQHLACFNVTHGSTGYPVAGG